MLCWVVHYVVCGAKVPRWVSDANRGQGQKGNAEIMLASTRASRALGYWVSRRYSSSRGLLPALLGIILLQDCF